MSIVLQRISVNNTVDLICMEVKRALQSGNVFIVSDGAKDIEIAWEKFLLLKRKKGERSRE